MGFKSNYKIIKDQTSRNYADIMSILPTSVPRYEIPVVREPGYPWTELYGAMVAGLALLCCGIVQSYTSGAIYSVQSDTTWNIALTHSDVAWIAAAPPLASLIGTIISGPIMEKWGRKNTVTFLSIPSILGWLIVGVSLNFTMLFIGRLFSGIALGMARTTAPIYVSEIARAKHRGKLGYLPPIMSAVGVLVGCVLSSSLNWRMLALLMTSFPFLLFLLSLFLPESPHWLIRKNREEQAYKNLKSLRYRKGNLNDDFKTFKEIAEIRESIEDTSPFPEKNNSLRHLIHSSNTRTPATLVFILMAFQQFSGLSAVIYYLKMILNYASTSDGILTPPNHHEKDLRPAIVGVVHVLSFFLTFPLVDKVGRKCLLKVSGVFMFLSHLLLAYYFYFICTTASNFPSPLPNTLNNSIDLGNSNLTGPIVQRSLQNDNRPSSVISLIETYSEGLFDSVHSYFPLICLCLYITSFSLASPIPYILMGEMFGTRLRSFLGSMAILICNLSSFVVVFLFPALMYGISPAFTFLLFALCSLVTSVIGCVIPETKGKSLQEIENLFKGPRDFKGKVKQVVEVDSCTEQFHFMVPPPTPTYQIYAPCSK